MGLKDLDRGSKHQFILAVMEHGFTYRDAAGLVDLVFQRISTALARGETVDVEGFGTWRAVSIRPQRAYRFGKVVLQRNSRIKFTFTGDATGFPVPNSTEIADQVETELDRYYRAIRRFVLDELHAEDLRQFWVLRWNSPMFKGVFGEASKTSKPPFTVEQIANAIEATRPEKLSRRRESRSVELVLWYAKLCAALDVDRGLWVQAERIVSKQF